MPGARNKIVFVVEEFVVGGAAQQLLDRFLIGYPRDGEFHRPERAQVEVLLTSPADDPELSRRTKDFGLVRATNLEETIRDASALVVVWQGQGTTANEDRLRTMLQILPNGASCFVHGVIANSRNTAEELHRLAASRGIALCAGTSTAVTFRLPDVDLTPGMQLNGAMIVVQGPFPEAELDALDGLLPIIGRRRQGESGVAGVLLLEGSDVWRAGERNEWSRTLLASAISRSNNVQGDPVRDGRTQNVVGLDLVPVLARNPRCWLLEHRDGLRTSLMVLDGVVADYNFAVKAADGTVISAQLHRPPAPGREQFSRLTAVLEDFFRTGVSPWPAQRSVLVAETMEKFRTARRERGQ